jgi:hypothetical protein
MPELHLQSYLLAFDSTLLPTVLRLQSDACTIGADSDGPWVFEKAISVSVLAAGWNLAATQYLWAGMDFRNTQRAFELCRDSVGAEPHDALGRGRYAGVEVHPLEMVFLKSNRDIDVEVLHQITLMAHTHTPWAVPSRLFCG